MIEAIDRQDLATGTARHRATTRRLRLGLASRHEASTLLSKDIRRIYEAVSQSQLWAATKLDAQGIAQGLVPTPTQGSGLQAPIYRTAMVEHSPAFNCFSAFPSRSTF